MNDIIRNQAQSLLPQLQSKGQWSPGQALCLSLTMGRPPQPNHVHIEGGKDLTGTADYHGDPIDLDIPLETVESLFVDGVLESLPHAISLAQLCRWYQWLTIGGKLTIVVTDVLASLRALLDDDGFAQKTATLEQLFQTSGPVQRDGWYVDKLRASLEKLGFTIEATRTIPPSHGQPQKLEFTARKRAHQSRATLLDAARTLLDRVSGISPVPNDEIEQLSKALGEVPVAPVASPQAVPAPTSSTVETGPEPMQADQLTQARDAAATLVALMPDDPHLILTLAACELKLGAHLQCEALLLRTERLAPAHPAIWESLADHFKELAQRYEDLGSDELAATNRQRADNASLNAGLPPSPATTPAKAPATSKAPVIVPNETPLSARQRSFTEAETAAGAGNWPEAAQLFSAMTLEYPTFAPAFIGLASAAFANGEVERGTRALENACDLQPDNLELRVQLGVTLAHAGQLTEAQNAFVAVLQQDRDNIDALLSLAQLCRVSSNFSEAVELLAHAHRAHPQNADVLAAIADLALTLRDTPGATTALQALASLAPQHPELKSLQTRLATLGGP